MEQQQEMYLITISTIIYLRNLFKESSFNEMEVNGMKLRILKETLETTKIISWLKGIKQNIGKISKISIGIFDGKGRALEIYEIGNCEKGERENYEGSKESEYGKENEYERDYEESGNYEERENEYERDYEEKESECSNDSPSNNSPSNNSPSNTSLKALCRDLQRKEKLKQKVKMKMKIYSREKLRIEGFKRGYEVWEVMDGEVYYYDGRGGKGENVNRERRDNVNREKGENVNREMNDNIPQCSPNPPPSNHNLSPYSTPQSTPLPNPNSTPLPNPNSTPLPNPNSTPLPNPSNHPPQYTPIPKTINCICQINNKEKETIRCQKCQNLSHVVCNGYFSLTDRRIPKEFKCPECKGEKLTIEDKKIAIFRRALSVVFNEEFQNRKYIRDRIGLTDAYSLFVFRKLIEEGFIERWKESEIVRKGSEIVNCEERDKRGSANDKERESVNCKSETVNCETVRKERDCRKEKGTKMVAIKNEKVKKKVKEYFNGGRFDCSISVDEVETTPE